MNKEKNERLTPALVEQLDEAIQNGSVASVIQYLKIEREAIFASKLHTANALNPSEVQVKLAMLQGVDHVLLLLSTLSSRVESKLFSDKRAQNKVKK